LDASEIHAYHQNFLIVALINRTKFGNLHENVIPQLLDLTFMTGYWDLESQTVPLPVDMTETIQTPLFSIEDFDILRGRLVPRVHWSHEIEDYIRHLLIAIREQPLYGGGLEATCFADLELACR
jgi:hypothetical protein